MEHREIFTVIIAVALVIIVIGVLGMISSRTGSEDSTAEPAVTTERPPITQETDIWDLIHSQQAAMMTEATEPEEETVTDTVIVTDEEGNPVTDEDGNPVTEAVVVTDEDGNPVTGTSAVTDEDGNPVTEETTTTTETVTNAAVPADPNAPAHTEININLG